MALQPSADSFGIRRLGFKCIWWHRNQAVASEQSIFRENHDYKSFSCVAVNTYVPIFRIFRGLDARGGRKLQTETHTHTHTHTHIHTHTHTHDNYGNPRCTHARRWLITASIFEERHLDHQSAKHRSSKVETSILRRSTPRSSKIDTSIP